MAMEQNYVDSEYESKLEFQSMWDDLKNKVQAENGGTGSGEMGRGPERRNGVRRDRP